MNTLHTTSKHENTPQATSAPTRPGSYRRKVRSGHISVPTFKFGRNVPVTLIDLGIVLVWACLITVIVV